VSVAGENARNIFFGDKDLDLAEGYKVLFGGAPTLNEIQLKENANNDMVC